MPSRAAVNASIRRLWSLPNAGFLAAGVVAGLAAWGAGPRAALALLMGTGTTGGLLVLTWFRARFQALNAKTARLQSSQQELQSALDRRLRSSERRLRSSKRQLLAAHGETERRIRVEVSTAEQRLRSATSGDLVALEKRLRAIPRQPE